MIFNNSVALRLPLPAHATDIVGDITTHTAEENEDFFKIARQYDLGFFELVEANPHVDPEHLIPGTDLIIPEKFILPKQKRQGIIVNLGAMRLYYFPEGKNYFYTYPIGIGKENWDTPIGKFSIVEKTKDPYWFVPDSIYEYRKKHGDPILKVVKPGKDNPLGRYAMRLSNPTYLIHGTNDPNSVGVRSSAGCIHLYPEDIESLFNHTPLKTKVTIINNPYLFGWDDKKFVLEAHLPLIEVRKEYSKIEDDIEKIKELNKEPNLVLNKNQTLTALHHHLGIPMVIGNLP